MDRAERTGLGLAFALHIALFAALSLNLLKPPPLPRLETSPIEVTLSDEIAPVSSAPVIAPAPSVSEPSPQPAEPPPAPAPLPRTEPQPLPKPARPIVQPKPAAKPVAKQPAARPAPAQKPQRQAQPQRRPGLSRDIVAGLRDSNRPAAGQPSAGQPAAKVSAAVASSIGAEVRRQLKPHWKSPTGADVELIRTKLSVRLNRDGSLAGAPTLVSQTGVNASNRAQARIHVDQAIKAVRLAAPFKLPADYYEAWREIEPVLYKGL